MENKKYKFPLIFKIIISCIYAIVTIFLLILAIDTISSLRAQPDNNWDMLGFVLATIIYGLIGYGIVLILSIVFLIVVLKNKLINKKPNIIYSIIFTILPIVSFVLFLHIVPKLV